MGLKENNTSNRKGKRLKWDERLIIERLYRKMDKGKITINQITTILGRHVKKYKKGTNKGGLSHY